MKEDQVILVIEQDLDDVFLLEKAFREIQIPNRLHVIRHVDEAKCYLNGVGVYANRVLYAQPALIILNLAVSRGQGLALLRWIRSNEVCKTIPLVAVGRDNDGEAQSAYDLGANAYFRRRQDLKEVVQLVDELELLDEAWDLHDPNKAS